MTKRLSFFFGIWLGIVLGAWIALIGNNEHWKWEAWNHHAATWNFKVADEHVKWTWHWIDENYPTPTPLPRETMERL